ncbi:MAG: hypothetical protein SGILL_000660 [Bacillariaceae sp.]
MNLELLDPFRRQVPDRIDSTLSLPEALKNIDIDGNIQTAPVSIHPSNKPPPPLSAHHIAFNRRGSYVAVGYANGTIAVYDVLSRTVSSVYRLNIAVGVDDDENENEKGPERCVAAAAATAAETAKSATKTNTSKKDNDGDTDDDGQTDDENELDNDDAGEDSDDDENEDERSGADAVKTSRAMTCDSFATDTRTQLDQQLLATRHVPVQTVNAAKTDTSSKQQPMLKKRRRSLQPLVQAIQSSSSSSSSSSPTTTRRYPAVTFDLPHPIGSTLQIHPKDSLSGFSVLQDGSLVIFVVPAAAFEESKDGDDENSRNSKIKVLVSTVFADSQYTLTCACLDPHGEKLYAGTQEGKMLGFEVKDLWDRLESISPQEDDTKISVLEPSFIIPVPGGASVWHMVVSRNGKYVVLNSADAALRLYSTIECWTAPEEVEKPLFVFQDVVNKVKFASCDISGDGEFVAGGAQGEDTKYEVYVWNTTTGVLADKLTGAPVDLYSIAWQPTRTFLAVAASDGLVDVWGPRVNWTAFAPDFQALPHNVEYVEREDEFDEVAVAEKANSNEKKDGNDNEDEEKATVDILTLHKIPVFQSDSEEEENVFHFDAVRPPTLMMSKDGTA